MLVVTTGNLEEVTLEFVTEGVTDNLLKIPISPIVLSRCCVVFHFVLVGGVVRNVCIWKFGDADFGAHALLHEGTELAFIVDFDDLLRPVGRVGDVELHLDGGCAVKTVARSCRLE